MRNIYAILEYDKIRNLLADFANTELSLARIKSLSLINDKKSLKTELTILKEAIDILTNYREAPITSSKNLLSLIELARKGGMLTPLDFEAVANDILTANKLLSYLEKIPHIYENVLKKREELFDLSNVERKIHSIIAPDLRLFDSASPLLNKTRHNIDKLEKELSIQMAKEEELYSDYLSIKTITIRDGHAVLPVKRIYKNKVDGIIHDVSDSEQTVFIEPSSIVSINNEIIYEKSIEIEEIKRILKELTEYVLGFENKIIANNKIIGYLDFVFAKAKYALKNHHFVASISDDYTIDLLSARHPLISSDKVVANSFQMDKQHRLLLITGPNAGGKSVALKTVGLLSLMHLSGLAIPSNDGSRLPFFKNIFVDIGDSQSLSDNLSTFSGHIRNLSYIISEVKENDLVLIDEIGTGTSPLEGEALAIAIIDRLLQQKCFALISSHYEGTKAYALSHEGIQNASMLFDQEKLTPTYHLLVGIPGKSYGIEMAKRYNIDEEIIKKAKGYLKGKAHDELNESIDRLNKQEAMLASQREKNKALEETLTHKIREAESDKRIYQNKRERLEEDATEIKAKLIKDVIDELDDIRRSVAKGDLKLHEVIRAKSRATELLEVQDEDLPTAKIPLVVGDYAKIISLDIVGKITNIHNQKVELVSVDGLSFKSTLDKLVKCEPIQKISKVKRADIDEALLLKSDVKMELNVIGYHVDEALLMVDKYLDDARLRHFSQVRIIHGSGSGALRNAIHEYLKTKDFVLEYSFAGLSQGGQGATIVKLI